MPEHRRHDQGRRDKLAAVDEGHPGVGKQQIARGHRHARSIGRSKWRQPIASKPNTRRKCARLASTRETITCALFVSGKMAAVRYPTASLVTADGGVTSAGATADGRRVPRARPDSAPPRPRRAGSPSRPREPQHSRSIGIAARRHSGSAPAAAGAARPRSSRHRISQKPDPKNSQRNAIQDEVGWLPTSSIIPGASTKSSSKIEVAHAPEAAEFEKRRDTTEQRQEEPDFRAQPKIGHERTIHGSLASSVRLEGNRFARELAQRVHRRALLGFLLVAPPGRGKTPLGRSSPKS